MNADEMWNAMIDVISAMDYPTGDATKDEAFLLIQFYSAMESGGHESFLNSFEEDIERVGPAVFFHQLVNSLNNIEAADYAEIEKKYGLLLWKAYKELEDGGLEEESFYALIEKADSESEVLDPRLESLMEAYFRKLHKIWGIS